MSIFSSYATNSEGKLTKLSDGNALSPLLKTVRAPVDVFLKESGDRYVTERAAAVQSLVGATVGIIATIGHNSYQLRNGRRAVAF